MRAATLAVCVLLLGLFVLRADHVARTTSQTFDEGAFYVAGVSYWRTGDFRLNPDHPPAVKLLWAIPLALRKDVPFEPEPDAWEKADFWRVADGFLYESPVDHSKLLLAGRRVNIALATVLVALIAWWGYRLWGRGAGVLACALAATDPNLAAYAPLLSMDLGLALFATAAAYFLWEYAEIDRAHCFYLGGLCLGLALATKYTAVLTVAGIGAGVLFWSASGNPFTVPLRAIPYTPRARLAAAVSALIRLGLVAAVVVAASYWGVHALQWPAGFKQQLVRGDYGDPHYFLDGEISSTGWWRYFPEVLAVKTPPATILLAGLSVAGLFFGRRFTRRDVAFLFIPTLAFAVVMAATRFNLGWRLLLPAYPLLILLAARTATLVPRAGFGQAMGAAVLAGMVLWGATEVRHLGRELSYANGLGATRANLHERLGDSNIDWGQGLKALRAERARLGDPVVYLANAGTARPEAYGIRYERLPTWGQFHEPTPDRVDPTGPILVAVSVGNLQGTYLRDPTTYRWLSERQPISRTDGSIWLFDLSGDDDALRRLRQLASQR